MRAERSVAGMLCVWVALGSGCGSNCVDRDGDQRGDGCALGPDCDDADPGRAAACGDGSADCVAQPSAQGCACYAGTTQQCYSGPDATRGIGRCAMGRQLCPGGAWTSCRGEVLPDFEVCNGVDDDCDGRTDEGVASPCGGCDTTCSGGVWGPPVEPFTEEGELAVTPRGELTLRFTPAQTRTVWVPNTGEGTVSKIDADAAREVARYRVAGDSPERVAVDYLGDAWVLSPSLPGRSALTKLVGERERCAVADAGRTSSGGGQVLALGDDGCVQPLGFVGEMGEVARTLSIDGARAPDRELGGQPWIGLQRGQRLLQLSEDGGSVVREVPTRGLQPFDSAFDPWGTLWLIDRAGLLGRVNLATEPAGFEILEAPLRCYEFDSIVSDAQGLLTMTGAGCEDVVSYDPELERWQVVKTSGVLDTRGVTVLGGQLWVTHTAGRLSRLQPDPLAILETFELKSEAATPIESTALGADSGGRIWVVSSMGGVAGAGLLTGFDPGLGTAYAQLPVGVLPRPHGDITGSRRLGSFAQEGEARHRFDGCSDRSTRWGALHVAWTGGQGASTRVEARWAANGDALDAADWQLLGNVPADAQPFDTAFPAGGVVELRLLLRSASRLGAPRVTRVGFEWRCTGPQ